MIDAAAIAEDVRAGRAAINWAVLQFSSDPKLQQLQQTADLQAFLESLDEDDPYDLRELNAIGGVKQYIVMGRQNKLPFTQDGLTKKQGEDEIARAMAREQLDVYAEQYPWTKPMIEQGLARAETANCHSCVEKRLVQQVAQAVKDQLDKQGSPQDYPAAELQPLRREEAQAVRPDYELPAEDLAMWGAREPCALCTVKHLAQTVVLLNESLTGYPTYRWLAIGHMAEAEAEAPSLDMANRIREIRLQVMDELEYIPDLTGLIEELDAIIRG